MMKPLFKLDQLAQWSQGQILSTFQTEFSEFGTDTRIDLSNKIFIALKGENYDAHHFLNQAFEKNCAVMIIHELKDEFLELKDKVSLILVKDTLIALQEIARHYRNLLDVTVIGITGSNGKTTTKEFTAAILNQFKPTHFNKGSFNNHWGVPLTLLQISPVAKFAVIEMGMNHFGEIKKLVEIASPNIVVCTMVGHAHIEFFGSQKEIAKAKYEIYEHSSESTIRIFNQDQDLTFDMMYPISKKFPAGRMLSFSSRNQEADVFFEIIEENQQGLKIKGQIAGQFGEAQVPIFGRHNLVNLMAAANIAYASGMASDLIWSSLAFCKSAWGRNQFIKTKKQIDILFDGYNANPDSVRALLDNLKILNVKGRMIGVFGQMKELGSHAAQMHFELAQQIAKSGFFYIFFIGENYSDFKKGLDEVHFKNYLLDTDLNSDLKKRFLEMVNQDDFLVIKGSRGAKTERFVNLCEPLDWTDNYQM